jgi:hypothetical protein
MNLWEQFEPASCLPDNCNCELVRDSFIRQPSAFWSSFAYIGTSFATIYFIKNKTRELKSWAFVCFVMGLSSLFGHMSFTRLSLAFDISSIVLVLTFFPIVRLLSRKEISQIKIFFIFLFFFVILFLGIYELDKWPKVFLCLTVFIFVLKDTFRSSKNYKLFQVSVCILLASFGLFLLDEFHIGCDPMSFFQFHSIWHIGTALSMFFYGKWCLDEGF